MASARIPVKARSRAPAAWVLPATTPTAARLAAMKPAATPIEPSGLA